MVSVDRSASFVMPVLGAGIHELTAYKNELVDGRAKPGHDGEICQG
jgi:hypothetical protein